MNWIHSIEEGTAYGKIAEVSCQKNNVWYANASLLSVDSRGEFLLPLRTEVV
jgi:hypothetical protein